MKSPTTTIVQEHSGSNASPFALITERETAEEQRLHDATERLKDEELRQQKELLGQEAREEELYRADMSRKLLAEKDVIGKELAQAAKDMEKELTELEHRCAKRMPDVVAKQVKTALSLAA